ncbi:acyl-CoA thioesterase [Qipengyuania huizhouensis]|jgi:acyl-CoA thioesterase|uniref:acyl-CoA thioesterase n=1 Tax=Qipengyuania huizhouensis TaxID=2867245 RepID=UPI001C870DED|nr:thioesterase family protein [Qipengyuania huizhouensis]MBX7461786.1 thioesterase family protein [Qipengyuania huizhouensis]
MSIASLTDPITAEGGSVRFDNLDHWLQGRTLYGGASALIAYTAAVRAFPDLPPLRAGQVAFVAPTGPEVELKREIVRQGRNVTQVRSELWCEGQCTLTAFWLFGTEREANAEHEAAEIADWPGPPENAEQVMEGMGPAFIQNNFELRRAQDLRGPGEPVVRRWARLTTREGLDPVSELILLGDVMPPGAMRAMQRQGPISSINWSFNLLDTRPATRDGWWLSENASQHAAEGYSSERLRLWNADGQQVMDGMQCVAVFG